MGRTLSYLGMGRWYVPPKVSLLSQRLLCLSKYECQGLYRMACGQDTALAILTSYWALKGNEYRDCSGQNPFIDFFKLWPFLPEDSLMPADSYSRSGGGPRPRDLFGSSPWAHIFILHL